MWFEKLNLEDWFEMIFIYFERFEYLFRIDKLLMNNLSSESVAISFQIKKNMIEKNVFIFIFFSWRFLYKKLYSEKIYFFRKIINSIISNYYYYVMQWIRKY